MILSLSENIYLIIYSESYSKESFVKASRIILSSYAENLVQRIYNCLFIDVVNLVDEYNKYYKKEYSSFGKFLYWKYAFAPEIIEEVLPKVRAGFLLGYGDVFSGGDYNLGQFVMSESGLHYINKIFTRIMEGSHEN